jgi:hypothetical protein
VSEQSALDIAMAFLGAWTEGDFEKAGTYLADDFAFHGPIAHYTSASDFLSGSRPFIETIRPGWRKVAAFGDDREALLLYDLTLRSGAPLRIADHYVVIDGKIQIETILWDTHGSPFREGT